MGRHDKVKYANSCVFLIICVNFVNLKPYVNVICNIMFGDQ